MHLRRAIEICSSRQEEADFFSVILARLVYFCFYFRIEVVYMFFADIRIIGRYYFSF